MVLGPPRAVCVSRDEEVRRAVERALTALAITVEHAAVVPAAGADALPTLMIVDRATRCAQAAALRQLATPVIVVGDTLDDEGLLELLIDAPIGHVLEDVGDPDLGVTSTKLLTGDLFGLEKYLAADAAVHERPIRSDVDKRAVMAEIAAFAEAQGARRPVVLRVGSVVDELLMNALHDAPRVARATGSHAALDGEPAFPVVRWAADHLHLAVSVADRFGALRKLDVLGNVARARRDRGRPRAEDHGSGAGLGLYLVLANVTSLILNVDPGQRTEVICRWDLVGRGRAERGARSLHLFAPA
jgi:hypothetical protein